jgi:DeoR/GlpR family transcriptional regulator of sugar metabolism
VELVLSGGEIHSRKRSMVGDLAVHFLSRISANKAFIGVSGISADMGVTTSVLQETAVNEVLMKRCNGMCYVLADHSKVGIQNNFLSAPIDLVHTLITDEAADASELNRIRHKGVDVILV